MNAVVPWIQAYASSRGLRYEPVADERWLRAWEPFATVRTPSRYEHALHATGASTSITVARAVIDHPKPGSTPEVGTWIAIVQDLRIHAKAAFTNDFGTPFAEPLELVSLPRRFSGERAFDDVFASFAESEADLASSLSPSLRKLLLSWGVPVHAETRAGGFLFAPVSVGADARSLAWIFEATVVFAEKATKRRKGAR